VPFKHEAAALATWQSPGVALAGAANTLQFDGEAIRAYNTDGPGLVADITRNAGVALAGRDLLLIGAGGAAAGVLGPLIGQRPRRIVIANRTVARAQDTDPAACGAGRAGLRHAAGVRAGCPCKLADGFDVVINATASSLGGAGVPVPASVLKPGALALDMMYGPAAQGFLDWATAHGARARDGLGMLVEQAAESFLIWRGVRPHSLPGAGRAARDRGQRAQGLKPWPELTFRILRWLLQVAAGGLWRCSCSSSAVSR
jgi:shikimate dehydrogenase